MIFGDVPLGDHTLKELCDFLGIKIKGIFARDQGMKPGHSPCIIDPDDQIGGGTHWVACFDEGKTLESFDSFAVPPPEEWLDALGKRRKCFLRNSKQIQEWKSVRCGWYCLYILNEKNKGNSFEKLLSVFGNDLRKNEQFIKKYFSDIG